VRKTRKDSDHGGGESDAQESRKDDEGGEVEVTGLSQGMVRPVTTATVTRMTRRTMAAQEKNQGGNGGEGEDDARGTSKDGGGADSENLGRTQSSSEEGDISDVCPPRPINS
jgi:hypothetical protein